MWSVIHVWTTDQSDCYQPCICGPNRFIFLYVATTCASDSGRAQCVPVGVPGSDLESRVSDK